MTESANTVVIVSDEHNRDVLGCYGDPAARTPNLDRLAREGVLFRNAYTNSPTCVPARASLATGRYAFQTGLRDSATPYRGSPRGWAARLRDAGHETVSIGKLHFRSASDDNGFSREIDPMHVRAGVGFAIGLLRDPPAPMPDIADFSRDVGRGESAYTRYDRATTRRAVEWIAAAGERPRTRPWVLQVGLVAPHYPLVAPEEFHDLYEEADIPPPRQYDEESRPRHAVLDAYRASSDYDDGFDPERAQAARHAYYGLCSFLDRNVGLILGAVAEAGLADSTRIVYTSDHGENLGHRGLWGKSVMYDDSAAVPLLLAGPGLPAGLEVETPVSLVDLHPTLTEFAGEARHPDDGDLPGESLIRRLENPAEDRAVFSEYHDWSSITGMFMLRTLKWKIVRYPGHPDQLFDMENDPREETDLAGDPEFGGSLRDMRARLARVADIEEANRRAFAAQAARIEELGGRQAILANSDFAFGFTPVPDGGPD